MITKELFIKMMKATEKFASEIDRWNEFGIELYDSPIGSIPWDMFNCWVDSHFDKYGQDWISWYLWDRKSISTGEILACYDEQGKEFYVNTLSDLWNLVKPYRLKYCNQESKCKFKCTNS